MCTHLISFIVFKKFFTLSQSQPSSKFILKSPVKISFSLGSVFLNNSLSFSMNILTLPVGGLNMIIILIFSVGRMQDEYSKVFSSNISSIGRFTIAFRF